MSSLPKPADSEVSPQNPQPEALSSSANEPGPMEAAVLFVDLVNSSVFASVLGLKEYADYLGAFHQMCISQCSHFFDVFLEGRYQQGKHYRASIIGDELLVTMYTGRGYNDEKMPGDLFAWDKQLIELQVSDRANGHVESARESGFRSLPEEPGARRSIGISLTVRRSLGHRHSTPPISLPPPPHRSSRRLW